MSVFSTHHIGKTYIYYYLGYSIIVMDSSSKFFFSFSVNYAMIVKLVDLIILL